MRTARPLIRATIGIVQMPERFLSDPGAYLAAALAIFAAFWGGLVSYFARINAGLKHSPTQLTIHIVTSGFAGFMAYLICMTAGSPPAITGAVCGIAGHMGTEAIRIFEERLRREVSK